MLISEEIKRVNNVVIIDQLLSFDIKIHFPRNIDEGGKPPKLILNIIEFGQLGALTKTPASFLLSSDIMKITDK